jgi:hypothetical protein
VTPENAKENSLMHDLVWKIGKLSECPGARASLGTNCFTTESHRVRITLVLLMLLCFILAMRPTNVSYVVIWTGKDVREILRTCTSLHVNLQELELYIRRSGVSEQINIICRSTGQCLIHNKETLV